MRTAVLRVTGALAIVFAVHANAAVLYRVVDLGEATATDINDLGQVVGWIGQQAFRTAPNQAVNPATDLLGSLTPGNSYAYGINNLGQVVGGATASGHMHAFCTRPNQPINAATDDLGTLGGDGSYAYCINNRGEVVGGSMMPGNLHEHAFRTRPGLPIDPTVDDLGTLGGRMSIATSINSSGQVTGWSETARGLYHAFRTAPGRPIDLATDDLGTLGAWTSVAGAINDLGQVAGGSTYSLNSGINHAFRTAPNRPIDPATDDLGPVYGNSPGVNDMNDRGDIVGWYETDDDQMRPFAILGSATYDLNDVVEGDLGLEEAHGVNNLGQIVVNGAGGHAYRLDPRNPLPVITVLEVSAPAGVRVAFTAVPPTSATTYHLETADAAAGPWTTVADAALTKLEPDRYQFTVAFDGARAAAFWRVIETMP